MEREYDVLRLSSCRNSTVYHCQVLLQVETTANPAQKWSDKEQNLDMNKAVI